MNESINHVASSVCVASRYSALEMDLLITFLSSNDHITHHNNNNNNNNSNNNNSNNSNKSKDEYIR